MLGIDPIDTAAHLKLVGDSLSIIGIRLQEHRVRWQKLFQIGFNFVSIGLIHEHRYLLIKPCIIVFMCSAFSCQQV